MATKLHEMALYLGLQYRTMIVPVSFYLSAVAVRQSRKKMFRV